MELQELQNLSDQNDIVKIINEARYQKPYVFYNNKVLTFQEVEKMYDPKKHKVMNPQHRKNKFITVPDPLNGGAPVTEVVKVARIPLAFQKIIVDRAVSFTCGDGIDMTADSNNDLADPFLDLMKKVWKDNKMQYRISDICRRMISECESAVLWYNDDAPDGYWDDTEMMVGVKQVLRTKVLSPKLGDELLPMYNGQLDLIGFGRHYTTRGEGTQLIQHFDLYTDKLIQYFQSDSNADGWITLKTEQHGYGKIPVVYFNQPEPEWLDVQQLIERQEELSSNFADTNDYNGSPILAITGTVESLSAKGEAGKVVELSPDSKVEYITWNQAPHAIELEMTNNDEKIYTLTQTPNIGFDSLKKLSLGRLTGVAIKFLFMDAQMKAAKKQQGAFGEGLQRCLNFLKHALVTINPSLKAQQNIYIQPVFSNYLPADEMQSIQDIAAAIQAGIMSVQTGTELNPMIQNPITELARVKEEKAQLMKEQQAQFAQAQAGLGPKGSVGDQLAA